MTSYIDLMPTLLDLCGISPGNLSFDGESLAPLIDGNGKNWPERILFTDTQREEHLVKGKDFAVMTDHWRLVGRNELYELYDMPVDPGQQENVAETHPEVVEKLLSAYEGWWKNVSANKDQYHHIIVGTSHENPVRLNSHDLHATGGYPAWSQSMVRAGEGFNGFWPIEIARSGTYEIELCRWPKESGLKLHDSAPVGDDVPGGEAYAAGKPLKIQAARIKTGGQEYEKNTEPGAASVKFNVKLEKGQTFLQTWMSDEKGVERAAYYVYISSR
jgi:hypothetical protein